MPTAPALFYLTGGRILSEKLELWGGLECSVVRIHNEWRDQLKETNHYERLEDLDAIAAVGIKTLRYPILLDHVAPNNRGEYNWENHDRSMQRLQELGIEPIVGLMHHGCGPHYTHFLDPEFHIIVSEFAAAVAQRYPWVKKFTPINEPNTTARFSGLYGTWYPHSFHHHKYLHMLFNQCRAVLYSMREIRKIIPDAELIQTEDIGKSFSSARMAHMAEHYNERRWLSNDLLAGYINRAHGWWYCFVDIGIPPAQLDEFLTGELGRMTMGWDYYQTSERYLDHRICNYPEHLQDHNNGLFVDVEAVLVENVPDDLGLEYRLEEVFIRYPHHDHAITEVHLGAHNEEQIRWVLNTWEICLNLREKDMPIRAMTLWSLFGSIDWRSCLTCRNNDYEPGVFSLRDGKLEETELTSVARKLIEHGDFYHPCIEQPGWWKSTERFRYRARF